MLIGNKSGVGVLVRVGWGEVVGDGLISEIISCDGVLDNAVWVGVRLENRK